MRLLMSEHSIEEVEAFLVNGRICKQVMDQDSYVNLEALPERQLWLDIPLQLLRVIVQILFVVFSWLRPYRAFLEVQIGTKNAVEHWDRQYSLHYSGLKEQFEFALRYRVLRPEEVPVNSRQGPEQKSLLQKAHQFTFLFLHSLKLLQPPLIFLVAQYVL